MNNYITRLDAAKEKLQTAQNDKIRLEEKLKSSETKLAELREEMLVYDVTPDNIEAEIERLDDYISKTLSEIEEKLGQLEWI